MGELPAMAFYLRGTGSVLLGCALVFAASAPVLADGPNMPQHAAPPPMAGNQPHIAKFLLHANDMQAEVIGTHLDQIAAVTVASVEFDPGTLRPLIGSQRTADATQELLLNAQTSIRLVLGRVLGVDISFKDGHMAHLDPTVGPARPVAEIIEKHVEAAPASGIQLGSANDVPQGATLAFSLRMI